jgi:hypothetical protein
MAKYEVERFAPKFPPMTFDVVAEGSYDLESDTLVLSPAVPERQDRRNALDAYWQANGQVVRSAMLVEVPTSTIRIWTEALVTLRDLAAR